IANSTATTRGTYVEHSTGRIYLCTRSGTTAADATTVGFTSVDSGEEFENGTAMFQYYGSGDPPTKWTFTPGAIKPVGGLAIEREVQDDVGNSNFFRYVGGRVNQFTLNVAQEGPVTGVFSMLFLDLDGVGTSTGFDSRLAPIVEEPVAGHQILVSK